MPLSVKIAFVFVRFLRRDIQKKSGTPEFQAEKIEKRWKTMLTGKKQCVTILLQITRGADYVCSAGKEKDKSS